MQGVQIHPCINNLILNSGSCLAPTRRPDRDTAGVTINESSKNAGSQHRSGPLREVFM